MSDDGQVVRGKCDADNRRPVTEHRNLSKGQLCDLTLAVVEATGMAGIVRADN